MVLLISILGCGSEPSLEPLVDPADLDQAEWSVQERYRELRGRADAALDATSVDSKRLLETQGELGRWLFATRYNEPARRALGNAQRLDPADRQWPYLLARLAIQRGDPVATRRDLERTLELDRDYAPAQIALAELELGRGDVERARSLLEPVAARGIDRAAYDLAKIDIEQGDFDRAAERLRGVVTSQPDATAAHQLLAMSLRSIGEIEQAREHMELAMGDDANSARQPEGLHEPMLPDPIIVAAQALRTDSRRLLDQANQAARQGRHRQAVEFFERALQAAPDAAAPRVRYSAYLMQRGRRARALALLSEAMRLDPADSSARYRLAVLLVQSGEVDQAVTQLEGIVEEDPRNVSAHLLLAEQYQQLKRDDDAVRQLESLLTVDPNSDMAARRLIRYHFEGRDCDQAATRAGEAVALHRDDRSFAYWLAWIDLWCGRKSGPDTRDALEDQAHAVTSLDSGMVDALWAQVYAQALLRSGEPQDAARLQSQVLGVLDRPRDSEQRATVSERLAAYRRGQYGSRALPTAGLDRYVPAPPRLTER